MIIATQRRQNGTGPPPATIKVAIYTRQSVADDLEFNSLDAQRQAVEAYIQSQRSQGWEALPERFDDHGFSGGNIERPAFKRLIVDVEAGKIDVVAVHRLDRLSRSIGDFVRVMEFLSKHGASLVSTTQAFDTSTSLGRMTVNLLATFATYERDMIRERTAEKMAATRRRGLWVGGTVVLGYDLKEKKLVVNAAEAERVREIFKLYLVRGSLLAVAEELNSRAWETKKRIATDTHVVSGGRPWDKHAVKRLLTNPTYVGQVLYRGELHDGVHPAIVDRETWDAVQALLREHRREDGRHLNGKSPALLRGLVRCACGASMTVQSARKGLRKYLYYCCAAYMKQGAAACPGSRVATRNLEAFVVERIQAIGRDPALVRETIQAARPALESRRPEMERDLRRLEKDHEKLDRERRNLVGAVGKGKASPGILQRLGELDVATQDHEAEAAKLQDELVAMEAQVIEESDLRAALASFTPVWAELFPAERSRIMQLLVQSVTFDAQQGEVAITFRPTGVRTLARQDGEEKP